MEVESFRIDHQGIAGVEDHLLEVSESVLQMLKRCETDVVPCSEFINSTVVKRATVFP